MTNILVWVFGNFLCNLKRMYPKDMSLLLPKHKLRLSFFQQIFETHVTVCLTSRREIDVNAILFERLILKSVAKRL